MESLEHAWDCVQQRRVWAFQARSGGFYCCSGCRAPAVALTASEGHSYFAHSTLDSSGCRKLRGNPDMLEESKHLLVAALELQLQLQSNYKSGSFESIVSVERGCGRCGHFEVRDISYD